MTRSASLSRSVLLLLAPVLVVAFDAAPAFAQGDDDPLIRNLALDGDDVDGAAPDETLSVHGNRDSMAAGAGGVFFMQGALTNGQTQRTGFFTTGTGGTQPVLLFGDPLPLQGDLAVDGLTVSFLDEGRMIPSGDILLRPLYFEGANLRAYVTRYASTPSAPSTGIGTALADRRTVAPLATISSLPSSFDVALNGGVLVTAPRVDNVEAVVRRVGYGAGEILVADRLAVPGIPGARFSTLFTAVSVASDGQALLVANIDADPGRVLVRVAAPPSASVEILQGRNAEIAGTGLRVHGFHQTTFGAGVDGQIRSGWLVSASVDPDEPFAQPTAVFVFDTGQVSGPVMGTGDGADGFSIAADRSTELDFTFADDGQVVAVAETSGPGISGTAPGVWRRDPREAAPLSLMMYEGGPLPGGAAEVRTVFRLYVVSVARDGRVAAEVLLSDGQQALILEHPDRRGEMVVVAGTRSDMETETGPLDVIQLLGLIPQQPVLVGTGQDGRRTRFSPEGDLVFFARTDSDEDPTDRNGLFTVRIGPLPEVTDVKVRKRGSTLDVRGGRGDCIITLEVDNDGGVAAFPGEGTTVNGERGARSFTGIAGLRVRMSDGNDRVELRGPLGGEGATLAGNVVVDLGPGGDTLVVRDRFEIAGSLTINAGKKPLLDEHITLDAVGVGRNFKLVGSTARVTSSFEDLIVTGKSSVQVGGDRSRLLMTSCTLLGKTAVKAGHTSEAVFVEDSRFGAPVVFDTGRGVLDDLRVYRTSFDSGSVRVKAKKSLNVVVRLEDAVLESGALRIDTGKEGSDVVLLRADVNGPILVTSAGSLPDRDHEIRFHNSLCEDSLRVKGKGNVRISFGDVSTVRGGIDVRLKPAGFHSITMFALEVDRGDVSVRAPATGAFVSLRDLAVRQGGIRVAASQGPDEIFLNDVTSAGPLRVEAGAGDDQLSVRRLGLFEGARIDGGSGNDSLAIDTATRRDADGEVVVVGIESETSNDEE